MLTPSPTDPSPRQSGGAEARLILSAATASDPARLSQSLKRMVELSRAAEGVLSRPDPSTTTVSAPANREPNPQPGPQEALFKPPAVVADIDALSATIQKVGRRLGCPHCCSGFDIDFQREIEASARTSQPTIPRTTL
jgi:hypothetical protein